MKYSKSNNQVEINDGINQQKVIYYSLMILPLINSILYLVKGGDFVISYSVLGTICLIFLIYYLKKISFQKVIPLDDIKYFKSKKKFGSTRYYFKLKNGKKRYLYKIDSLKKIDDIYILLKSLGIDFKTHQLINK